jgi:hypothetical protein
MDFGRLAAMGDGNSHACLERIEAMCRDLADRVLMLEVGLKAPVSYIDRLFAEQLDKKRHEPHEEARARVEAYRKARDEAHRNKMRLEEDQLHFTDALHKAICGEFDRDN